MKKDLQAAFKYFGKAAQAGNSHAQYRCASMIISGEGIAERDCAVALELYIQSAEAGHEGSHFELGLVYWFGKIGDLNLPEGPNKVLAFKWYLAAARQGNKHAQLIVATMFAAGEEGVVQQSDEGAVAWLTRSSDQGLPAAQELLGTWLYTGQYGCPADTEAAILLFVQAAASGSKNAAIFLFEQAAASGSKCLDWLRNYSESVSS